MNDDLIILHEATAVEATEDGGHNVGHVWHAQLVTGCQAVGQQLRLAAQNAEKVGVQNLKDIDLTLFNDVMQFKS